MSAVYSWLARRMTDFENHETQNGYESSLTLKLALFQSINSYFSLIYIVSRCGHWPLLPHLHRE